jgi:MFS transporter, DHA1 family, tetracycline resistance protein
MNNYRILLVTNSISFGTAGIYLPLMTLYLQGLGADLALISIILTSSAIVGLAGSYVWGRLADRVGRRKPFYVGGLAAAALGYVWLSQANSVGMAWSARLWDGLSGAAVMTVGLTMLGDALATSPNKGRSMGLVRGSASLVWALGAFAGGRIADAFSLQTAFLICSGMFGISALIALLLQETPVAKPLAPVPAPAPELVEAATGQAARPRIGLPVLFLAGVVLWGATDMASSTMWPNYLGSLGYSKTTISSLFSLAAFVEMPAMVVFGSLSDFVGRTIMLAAGGFVFALVQASYIFFVQNLPALLGIQVVRGLGYGSYTASAMTFATEQGGHEDRGSNSGLFNAMSSAGMLTGTMLGGTVAQAFGFTTLYALCAVMAAGAGACFLALRHRERRTGQVAAADGKA